MALTKKYVIKASLLDDGQHVKEILVVTYFNRKREQLRVVMRDFIACGFTDVKPSNITMNCYAWFMG